MRLQTSIVVSFITIASTIAGQIFNDDKESHFEFLEARDNYLAARQEYLQARHQYGGALTGQINARGAEAEIHHEALHQKHAYGPKSHLDHHAGSSKGSPGSSLRLEKSKGKTYPHCMECGKECDADVKCKNRDCTYHGIENCS